MKICLYFEGNRAFGGALYRGVGTGLLSSYRNQMHLLKSLGIPWVARWDSTCDLIQVNTPWLRSLVLMQRARRQSKKVVVWAHVTAEDTVGVFHFTRALYPLTRKYLAYAYNRADQIWCPSEYTRDLVHGYGIPESKLAVVSNGVNVEKYRCDAVGRARYRERYGLEGLVIGTMALAIPRKGIDTFLEMARRFPQHRFIWYGRIYHSFLARSLPRDLPPNVQFAGYVDDAAAAMSSLDVFLFPSHEENQGIALMEAGASGLPLLVRRLPAYRGWLRDGENCLMADSDDDFEAYLRRLITDASLRERLACSAVTMAEGQAISLIGEKVKRLYGELLGNSQPAVHSLTHPKAEAPVNTLA